MRRFAISLSGLVAVAITFVTIAPAAFAMSRAGRRWRYAVDGVPGRSSCRPGLLGGLADRYRGRDGGDRSGRGHGDQGFPPVRAGGRDQLTLTGGRTAGTDSSPPLAVRPQRGWLRSPIWAKLPIGSR